MAGAYTTPGGYTGGVWLVAFPNGAVAIYNKTTLPAPDGRIRYYWLGATPAQANPRIAEAIGNLNLNIEQIPIGVNPGVWQGRPQGLNTISPPTGGKLAPGAGGQGTATYSGGPFSGISNAIQSVEDFLKFISWIFHPRNLLRAVEFLSGIVLMIFGLWAAIQARGEGREGFTTGEAALTRSGLGRVARELGRTARAERKEARSETGRRQGVRPRAAPHRQRRTALRVRYAREENVSRRREHSRRRGNK